MILQQLGKIAVGFLITAYSIAIPAALLCTRNEDVLIEDDSQKQPVIALLETAAMSCNLTGKIPVSMTGIENMIAASIMFERESECVPRYAGINMSDEERRELAGVIFLESATQCREGQQAVAEVILNRVISPDFPDTVHDVLYEGNGTRVPQFSTIENINIAEPGTAQYEAINAALHGPSILPEDVVFFSRYGENDRVWGKIQDHVFCYKYIWE